MSTILTITPNSQYPFGSCIKVTGKVFSIHPGGTVDMADGDLHFTLTLDSAYAKYSQNGPDCEPKKNTRCADIKCLPPTGPCTNIIVEEICHNPGLASIKGYFTTWKGDYCKDVKLTNLYGTNQFPTQGDRISVSGRLVHETGSENWNEIHPASIIKPTK